MARSREDEPTRRQGPPNYFSRRVQLRLMLLVGAFMLVIVMMEEARKPKYYAWMWGDEAVQGEQESAPEGNGDVDTRLAETARRATERGVIDTSSGYDSATRAQASEGQDDPFARAAVDAWGEMLGELSLEGRREFNRAMWLSRQQKKPTPEQLQVLSTAISSLETALDRYAKNARAAVRDDGTLDPETGAAWLEIIDRLEETWQASWKPALNSFFEQRDPTTEHTKSLAKIQSLVDELDVAAILDNSFARPQERNAWFRFIEQLRAADSETLQEDSVGVVGFLQLHKQPKDYRGKLVTIRGQARLGYRVTAPKNIYGVKEYNLLWLRPRGGPNTLVAVYCLEAPGLPPLKHKDHDRGVTELAHDVQITGYFFKKWAYRARDGARTAPQLLAKAPEVESAPMWTDGANAPGASLLTIVTAIAAVVGVAMAAAFFYLNQWPSRTAAHLASSEQPLEQIDPSEVSAGVSDELRKLESDHRSGAD